MDRFNYIIEYNIDGEDKKEAGMYEDYIGQLLTRIWDKNEDGFIDLLKEHDYLHLLRVITFLEGLGFVFPMKGEWFTLSNKNQLLVMKALFRFFLNIVPSFYSQNPTEQDLIRLKTIIDEVGDKYMIEFFEMQPPMLLLDFLTKPYRETLPDETQ